MRRIFTPNLPSVKIGNSAKMRVYPHRGSHLRHSRWQAIAACAEREPTCFQSWRASLCKCGCMCSQQFSGASDSGKALESAKTTLGPRKRLFMPDEVTTGSKSDVAQAKPVGRRLGVFVLLGLGGLTPASSSHFHTQR